MSKNSTLQYVTVINQEFKEWLKKWLIRNSKKDHSLLRKIYVVWSKEYNLASLAISRLFLITVYWKYFQVWYKFKEIDQLEIREMGVEFPNTAKVDQITTSQ